MTLERRGPQEWALRADWAKEARLSAGRAAKRAPIGLGTS